MLFPFNKRSEIDMKIKTEVIIVGSFPAPPANGIAENVVDIRERRRQPP